MASPSLRIPALLLSIGALAISCLADVAPAPSVQTAQALGGGCLSADPVRSSFRLAGGTDHITFNLDDYGVFLLEAKDPGCAATVAAALKSKIESTLRTPFTDAVTGSARPYSRWLDGGLVSLVFATALELGARGQLDSDLLAALLRVRDAFQFNRDSQGAGCGLVANVNLGNACMDDYAVGSTGYAWIAAFDAARGWTSDAATMANGARNLVHAAFGTWDSICIHDDAPDPNAVYAPRGVCNVKIDSTTPAERQRLNSGYAQAISFNHGFQNMGYGIGLLTSIASTANALAFAGQPFGLQDFEQDIARALLREAQAHTDPSGGSFSPTGCFTTDGYTLTPNHACADMNYAPRMFPVGSFLAGYAGAPAVTACPPSSPPGGYGFNLYASDADIVNAGLTWGRVAIYLHLGFFWSGAASSCGISVPARSGQVTKLPHACLADPPVGPGNSTANSAGTYDYYCGYYKYNYGTDYGYCAQASSYAAAVGATTAATGSCETALDGSPGPLSAYYAGYYDYLCRYYETIGYGWDYAGYCFYSDYYAAKGRCTNCDPCTPACTGKTCGTSDGCGGTCVFGSGCIKECAAQPQVGPGNANASNAGLYDYYCGYYLAYNNGNDYGYCQLANNAASAAGIHTAGTGICSAGATYNYQAGLYDYYCRYYEYAGYGWDYNGYCSLADSYVAQGGCTRCGQCRPSCSGKTCFSADGCGGTCYSGSGCCTPSCSGRICGQSDGCFSTCQPGSGCCSPVCSGKACGAPDTCGGTCQPGSGCTSAGPLQSYPPTGWIDGYNTQHVWGWACDPDYPDQSNRVDFYTTSWQGLGSVGAYLSSSAAIANACRGGYAHYFDFWPSGGIPSGTHFMAWSIDLPYATAGNDNRAIGGQGSVGNGTEFIMP